jgi:hypothetical protein
MNVFYGIGFAQYKSQGKLNQLAWEKLSTKNV